MNNVSKKTVVNLKCLPKNGDTFLNAYQRKKMPTIKCRCGEQILLVPDLKAMNRAIEGHIAQHNKAQANNKPPVKPDALRRFLTEQVLEFAAQVT